MFNNELKLKIENLKVYIQLEQENYEAAVQDKSDLVTLERLRDNIKKLEADLEVLLER